MKLPKLTDLAHLIETMDRHPFGTLVLVFVVSFTAWLARGA